MNMAMQFGYSTVLWVVICVYYKINLWLSDCLKGLMEIDWMVKLFWLLKLWRLVAYEEKEANSNWRRVWRSRAGSSSSISFWIVCKWVTLTFCTKSVRSGMIKKWFVLVENVVRAGKWYIRIWERGWRAWRRIQAHEPNFMACRIRTSSTEGNVKPCPVAFEIQDSPDDDG